MKRLILISILFLSLLACTKSPDDSNLFLLARIVGFDMNCSTCILEFPDDSSKVKEEIGQSPSNFYETINLYKDNYQIGQLLKVKIRNLYSDEQKPCITLYPSDSYKNIFITDFENFDNLILTDTVYLTRHDCLKDCENQFYICLDSVFNDSRCPLELECFWAGTAEVRFRYIKSNNDPILFNLSLRPVNYAIIDGFKFTLVDLSPYPHVDHQIAQEDYKAEITIEISK